MPRESGCEGREKGGIFLLLAELSITWLCCLNVRFSVDLSELGCSAGPLGPTLMFLFLVEAAFTELKADGGVQFGDCLPLFFHHKHFQFV